jgi:SAM-dependent methyltransferase
VNKDEFKEKIEAFLGLSDFSMEGYQDPDMQRDLSVKFHWGHNHDFGDFYLEGQMADRHLSILASFMDEFNILPQNLEGKRILDIGCWTGGTSLLLSKMGAEVTAIEEVKKYADLVKYLTFAFDIKNLDVLNLSLYDLKDNYMDYFDFVLFSGVLYHITDQILALRLIFNTLKDGGICLLESMALKSNYCYLEYYGPSRFTRGIKEDLNRSGWNWYVPSPKAVSQMMEDVGFLNIKMSEVINNRVLGYGQRVRFNDILRAGLSIKDIR